MPDIPSLPPLSAPSLPEQVRFLKAAVDRLEEAVLVAEAMSSGSAGSPGPRVVYANPACAALTGYGQAEIVGHSPRLFQGPKTDRAELGRLLAALARGESARGELVHYTKAGAELRAVVEVFPLRGDDGKVTHYLAIQRDAVAPRRAVARNAGEAGRGKTEVLAMASQEIRTPVNALLGFADLLFDSRLGPDQRDYVETIRACGEDLLRLANELLDLSNIEAGRLELAAVPFEPLALLQSVLGGFEAEIDRRGLDLTLQVDPEVPTHVVGDPTRLRQILHAALGVLLRSVDRGRIALGIGRAVVEGEGFRLVYRLREIEGGEAALPAAPLPPAASPAKEVRAAGGLDLTVARRLAQLMGGSVETRMEPGVGASFSFWVVVGECPPPEASAVPGSAPGARLPAAGSAPDGGLAILVVEDNPVNQKLLLALLKRLGYQADLAGHGGEALDRLRQRRYDIVFMDVQMPVMDGFQCTRRIRAGEAGPDQAAIPVVAVTAGAMRGDREKCLQAGMNEYLSKPISAQALQAVLDKVKEAKAAPGGSSA